MPASNPLIDPTGAAFSKIESGARLRFAWRSLPGSAGGRCRAYNPGMNDLPHRHRRWFRFSLRTLFVLVTACALWLGWNHMLVQSRLAARRAIVDEGGRIWVVRNGNVSPNDNGNTGFFPTLADITVDENLPRLRRWLGDASVWEFELNANRTTKMQVDQIRRLFPEARLHEVMPMERNEDGVFVIPFPDARPSTPPN